MENVNFDNLSDNDENRIIDNGIIYQDKNGIHYYDKGEFESPTKIEQSRNQGVFIQLDNGQELDVLEFFDDINQATVFKQLSQSEKISNLFDILRAKNDDIARENDQKL